MFFNFKAAVTICSDFGAPQIKVCHCFHCFLVYLPWSGGTRCHFLGWAFALSILKLFSFKGICHYRLWPRSEAWLQDVVTDSNGAGYQGLLAVFIQGRRMRQVTHICLSEWSSKVLFQMQWLKVSQFVKYLPQRKYISEGILSRNWATFGKA